MPPSSDQAVAPRRLPAWLELVLVMLPAVAAYGILARFYTAVPILDDYEQIFVFALQFAKMPTLASKFGLLFTTQVAAYKLIFEHFLAGLQIVCFGHMNFPVLIWICNLMPALIFVLISKHTDEDHAPTRGRLLLLLPVSLFLFSMNWAETLDWAACGLQEQVVIFFSLAALHFLTKPRADGWRLLAAVACGVAATSAFPNGMLVWPVGILYLLWQQRGTKGFLMRLFGWCLGFALSLGAYLYDYQKVGIVSKGTVLAKLMYAVMFSGSATENMHHRPIPYVSVVIGLAVLGLFVDAIRTKFYLRSPFLFWSTVWMLFTSLAVANARVGFGLNQSLSSRYKIYCDILLIFSYLYLVDRFRSSEQKKLCIVVALATAFGLVVCVGGDYAGGHLLKLRQERSRLAMAQYLAAPGSASPMFLFEDNALSPGEVQVEDKARVELNEAIKLGIYKPPVLP